MPDLRGLLARIGSATDTARDNLMPTPQALYGLLAPNDIATARNQGLIAMGTGILGSSGNIFQNLAHGVQAGQEGYKSALNDTLEQRVTGDALLQKKNVLQKQAQIAQDHPIHPGMSQDDIVALAMAHVNAGLPIPSQLGEIIKSMDPKPLQHLDLGDKEIVYANDPTKPLATYTKGISAQQQNTDARADRRITQQIQAGQARDEHRDAQDAAKENKTKTLQQNTIAHEFASVMKNHRSAEDAYTNSIASRKMPNNSYAQMAALEGLAKVLNPGVSVRSNMLQILKSYGSIGDRANSWIQHAMNGTMDPHLRNQIYAMTDQVMREKNQAFLESRNDYLQRGAAQGVDMEKVLGKPRRVWGADAGASSGADRVRAALGER